MKKLLSTVAFVGLLSTSAFAADAPSFPEKRVTIVVPFSAGGSTDAVARLLGSKLQAELGGTFIVENRPGASGNLAAEYVARSVPDGHTLLMGTIAIAANQFLYKKLSYDLQKDLVPVSQAVRMPLVAVTSPNFPASDPASLLRLVKAQPGKITFGSGGGGSSPHLGGVMFEHLSGGKMLHVPYKGTAPAMTDLLGGQIDIMFTALIDGMPFIKSGKVKPIGVTTPGTNPQLPNTASFATVLPGFNISSWSGLFTPTRTPQPVVEKLSITVAKIMQQPDVRKFVEEQGSEPVGSTPAEFRRFLAEESKVLKQLIEISGATAD